MTRQASVAVEDSAGRAVLIWQPAAGSPVEHDVWPERPLTIGRDATNSVVIESAFVSKMHAVIRYTAGQYQVEDLKSANGTKVNGGPVTVSALAAGDVLEVGDERFVFAARAASSPARAGLSKPTKLALTAVASLGAFGMVFVLLVSSGSEPAAGPASAAAPAPGRASASPEAPLPVVNAKGEAVRDVLARAEQAGVKPIDALFDEGVTALNAGRLREATTLFAAVLERDGKHEAATRRFAEARDAWARAIAEALAEAERAYDELRLPDAILAWGKVALLTDESDGRHKAAQDGIERAQKRLSR